MQVPVEYYGNHIASHCSMLAPIAFAVCIFICGNAVSVFILLYVGLSTYMHIGIDMLHRSHILPTGLLFQPPFWRYTSEAKLNLMLMAFLPHDSCDSEWLQKRNEFFSFHTPCRLLHRVMRQAWRRSPRSHETFSPKVSAAFSMTWFDIWTMTSMVHSFYTWLPDNAAVPGHWRYVYDNLWRDFVCLVSHSLYSFFSCWGALNYVFLMHVAACQASFAHKATMEAARSLRIFYEISQI